MKVEQMFLFLKKKADNTNTPDTAHQQPTPTSDFIPYYCHWDAHTLLTKNGELMQTIRITSNIHGRDYENGDLVSVRRIVRNAVLSTVDSDQYALWIHTVRRRR